MVGMRIQSGLTLIEMIVAISVLSIVTALIVVAFPVVRSQQALISAEQQIRSLVRQAQQRALEEVRDDSCIAQVGEENQRLCSDVGVALHENRIFLFADTQNDDRCTMESRECVDYIIDEQILHEPVTVEGNGISFVFEAVPPTIVMYVDGQTLEDDTPGEFELRAGQATRTIQIYRYGQVERGSEE